jgi:hypothetical protein
MNAKLSLNLRITLALLLVTMMFVTGAGTANAATCTPDGRVRLS